MADANLTATKLQHDHGLPDQLVPYIGNIAYMHISSSAACLQRAYLEQTAPMLDERLQHDWKGDTRWPCTLD